MENMDKTLIVPKLRPINQPKIPIMPPKLSPNLLGIPQKDFRVEEAGSQNENKQPGILLINAIPTFSKKYLHIQFSGVSKGMVKGTTSP